MCSLCTVCSLEIDAPVHLGCDVLGEEDEQHTMQFDTYGGVAVETDQRNTQVGNVELSYNRATPWQSAGQQLLGGTNRGGHPNAKELGNRVWFDGRMWYRLAGRWHIFGDGDGNCWNSQDGRTFTESVPMPKGQDKGPNKGQNKGHDKGPDKGHGKGPNKGQGDKGKNHGKGGKQGGKSPIPNKGKPSGKDAKPQGKGKPDDGKGKPS